jgi:apolipoprotein D and lipocalin family protein
MTTTASTLWRATAAGLAMLALSGTAPAQQQRLPTVPAVDLQRYAGTWHEVARLPNRFQAQCVAEVTAEYTPRDDGTVGVVNRCRGAAAGGADGPLSVAEGVARPVDATNARLRVSFLPAALRWLPVGWGDYWVLELDPEYRWALVGEPGRDYLWVLSRSPVLPQEVLQGLLRRAGELGFPVDRIILSARKPPG